MVEGLLALGLFFLFLWEWPRFIRILEAPSDPDPDPLSAKIRMARWKAGENPWPELTDKE